MKRLFDFPTENYKGIPIYLCLGYGYTYYEALGKYYTTLRGAKIAISKTIK